MWFPSNTQTERMEGSYDAGGLYITESTDFWWLIAVPTYMNITLIEFNPDF